MYLLLAILLPLLLLLFILNHWRRKRNIQKVCRLCMSDKCKMLSELIEPFGYAYVPSQDIFTSRIDSWQREFGYCTLYDNAAPHFNMVFDAFPVYFNYQGRTWLIEIWKGQYGINTGGEIGIYYADRILEKSQLKNTLFQAVEDPDMLRLSMRLYKDDSEISRLAKRHWWLTAFHVGCFSRPSDLSLRASITFPSAEMAGAFINGLHSVGYPLREICRQCNNVSFTFVESAPVRGFFHRLRIRMAGWQNRFWCRVYLFITRPFTLSVDRILYLYYYLPFAFRKTFRIRRYKKYKARRKSSR